MAQTHDVFADLFASTKKKDLSKLSLAERQRLQQSSASLNNANSGPNNSNNSNWSGLDLLDSFLNNNSSSFANLGYSNNNAFNNNTSNSNVNQNDSSSNIDDLDDLFAVFDTPPVPKSLANLNASIKYQPQDQINFASSPTSDFSANHNNVLNTTVLNRFPESFSNVRSNNNYSDDDNILIDSFQQLKSDDYEDHKIHPYSKNYKKNNNNNNNHSVFLDYEPKNYQSQPRNQILNQHHTRNDNFNDLFDDLSTPDLVSTATNLFNKSKNIISKNIEKYQAHYNSEITGKPAWMFQQQKYMNQNKNSNGFKNTSLPNLPPMDNPNYSTNSSTSPKLRQFKTGRSSNNSSVNLDNSHSSNSSNNSTPKAHTSQQFLSRQYQNQSSSLVDINSYSNEQSIYVSPARRRKQQTDFPTHNSTRPLSAQNYNLKNKTSKNQTRKFQNVQITSESKLKFNNYRNLGTDFFKKGDFTSALTNFELALNSLPKNHLLMVIAYSNLSSCNLKLGNSKKSLENIENALSIIGPVSTSSSPEFLESEIETGKTIKEFWSKLCLKKANSLEHLEKYKDALSVYLILIANGVSSKNIMDGKNRCQNALNPKPKPKPKPQSYPSNNLRKQTGFQPNKNTNLYSNKPSKAVKNIQREAFIKEKEENEKFLLYDSIELKINSWKNGKEDNLRALLASLDLILWPEANWKKISIADLVLDKKVKIFYLKAVAKTHPDKINKNATTEQKLIAQNVFVILNKAWDIFKEKNGIQ
ncbi:auxilin-like protein SWA2 ASCRUDRAFT_76413 [Ascoidea rubescens DSM 1968]|uniref:Uncharacterized protein n=1 Tax=Ascoidea rubescens DSM 1968 TaxID=1344418 RepID=A0A1D2VFX9_9ASCO|nr:hypothetical protein ASCRUDRAFT_76413 [Ascoidea rubescens DSM 1968]ODV60423.1 hypothetical protein ASCRUDRAFT_76413 [Ascoidea rubescens DSM 1968]